MGKLAVIGTFYKRYENTEALMRRVLLESTRPPDEFIMMCESAKDASYGRSYLADFPNLLIKVLLTPLTPEGRYEIIPYSNKINWALDNTSSDYIVYLDNNSLPHVEKYRLMSEALDNNPEWGAVFCSQNRTGFINSELKHTDIVSDAYCFLNYTQVMHRLTSDRWSLDMAKADPIDLADAIFWRDLHKSLGPFYPVAPDMLLDEHHMESQKAAGL